MGMDCEDTVKVLNRFVVPQFDAPYVLYTCCGKILAVYSVHEVFYLLIDLLCFLLTATIARLVIGCPCSSMRMVFPAST